MKRKNWKQVIFFLTALRVWNQQLSSDKLCSLYLFVCLCNHQPTCLDLLSHELSEPYQLVSRSSANDPRPTPPPEKANITNHLLISDGSSPASASVASAASRSVPYLLSSSRSQVRAAGLCLHQTPAAVLVCALCTSDICFYHGGALTGDWELILVRRSGPAITGGWGCSRLFFFYII